MIGVPGTAQRLFALRDEGISVVMISQGSSEHSICFAVPAMLAERARDAVERAFFAERHDGQIQRVDITGECSILAVVGDGMAGVPGIAAKFFTALAKARVNIRAIAQGASERNISVVVAAADTERALRAAHSGLYLSDQTISIDSSAPGASGRLLVRSPARPRLKDTFDVDLRIRAVATSRMFSDRAIDLGSRQAHRDGGEPLDSSARGARATEHLPHAAIVDCTASDAVARRYEDWLAHGIHVITPNKRANASSFDYYRRLRDANRAVGAHQRYEATGGAALPIIHTLRDLVQTGDEILEIEGILSGTLSYLFNAFDGSQPFSALVAKARDMGYTEPDPRDDLSGTDGAQDRDSRARWGSLELGSGGGEPVPEALQSGSVADFPRRSPPRRYGGRTRSRAPRQAACCASFDAVARRNGQRRLASTRSRIRSRACN